MNGSTNSSTNGSITSLGGAVYGALPYLDTVTCRILNFRVYDYRVYLINQTPGEKLRRGVALRASVTLVKSCEVLSQLDYFTLVLWIPAIS